MTLKTLPFCVELEIQANLIKHNAVFATQGKVKIRRKLLTQIKPNNTFPRLSETPLPSIQK